MNTSGWLGRHPDEGELLAFADRGLSAQEHEALASHLVDCDYCQNELALVQGAARTVAAGLGAVVLPPVSDIRKRQALKAVQRAAAKVERKRVWRTTYLPRVAAAVLFAVVGGAMAGPGLAFMRTVFASGATPPTPVVTPVVLSAPSAPEEVDASRLHVDWNAAEFVLAFEQVGGGTLEFRRQDGRLATLQVVGAPPSMTSGPAGVLIKNQPSGAARYVVTLPSVVTGVTVSVGSGAPVRLNPQPGVQYEIRELAKGRLVVSGG